MARRTNEEIAREWRATPFCEDPRQRAKNQAGALEGECGGFMVTKSGLGRRAHLKPTKRKDVSAQYFEVAAREKIAANLAHDLGLPVPPAQLAVWHDAPEGCEKTVVVSLVMYKTQWSWDQLRDEKLDRAPFSETLRRAIASAGAMLVFDTWLGQFDHKDESPHNVIWGYGDTPDDGRLMYVDFARSLSWDGGWADDGWRDVREAPFPGLLRRECVHADMLAMASLIEGFTDARIGDLVDVIPAEFLREDERQVIRTGLIGRRALVTAHFRDQIRG